MSNLHVRASPIANIPEAIIQHEHSRIHELQQKYKKLIDEGHEGPPSSYLSLMNAKTKLARNYGIEVSNTDPLSAAITSKHESPSYTHTVTLSVLPPTCSRGCLRLLGSPCKEMCTFASSINVDLSKLLPPKYTIKGCYEMLLTSLSPNHPKLTIDKEMLYEEAPIILPPHMRTSTGRPHTKRFESGAKAYI